METTEPAQETGPRHVTLNLDEPIVRGELTIDKLTVRKPTAGECRGLKLSDVGNGDVNALTKLLPRITTPALTEQEINSGVLSFQDLGELAGIIVDFLFTKARREGLPTT